ncbi:shikimate dehydrogenase [Paracoccus nototheniae]|uniref:shikimate dehydrogenase (NADP(+)) n=1 Tax=Paracoccus nototheniae TaxID=2489002 RepID=A0ABW4DZV0_9RHOB|nr:shikimate dehydrogenase [Paracoccus nototheniae]
MITGHTRIYGIVADPIHHVKTPEEMNAHFAALGHDGVLIPFHVRPPELAPFMDAMRAVQNFAGLIATVPHKTAMLAICDEVVGDAARIGAVNAVRRDPDGRLIGAMLDGRGFVSGLQAEGVSLTGMDACLLGAGGAGAAIAFALAEAGVARLTINNRSLDKARDLARRVTDTYPGTRVDAGLPDTPRHDLIVNATSLGLRAGDGLPLDDHAFRPGQIVAEAIMEPELTPLLALAQARGVRIHFGRPMLRHQIRLMALHMGAPPSPAESA